MWQTRTGTWTGRHPSDPLCGITITWPDDGKTRLERMRRLLKPAPSTDEASSPLTVELHVEPPRSNPLRTVGCVVPSAGL